MALRLFEGFLLAFQFFSSVPVHKEIQMKKPQVTAMYAMLPVVGVFIGGMAAISLWFLRNMTESSPLLIALLLAALLWALTGGLHMDGLADVGDAYFSYQDREKRLQIMGDPRIGAFGTMVLIFAIVGKIILLAEIVAAAPLFAIASVPIVSRIGLVVLFNSTKPAKQQGLAAYFQRMTMTKPLLWAMAVWAAASFSALFIVCGSMLAIAFLSVAAVILLAYKKWCEKNFGGVTGDLLGAFTEGLELLLWLTLLFFI